MPWEVDRRLLATLVVAIVIAWLLFYGFPLLTELYAPPKPPVYRYITGLRAKFTVINATSGKALTTGILAKVYSAGENPFAYGYTGAPVFTASYDSAEGAWVIGGIDMGSYVLVISDTSTKAKIHPVKTAIDVPGTNEEDREVWIDPASIKIFNIATITVVDFDVANLTSSKGAVSKVHLTYDGTKEGINGTDSGKYGQGDYWRITFDISVSAGVTEPERLLGPIRIYFTNLKEHFTFDQLLIDGTAYTLNVDDDATDDGYSGLYVEIAGPWKNGESHTIQLFLTQYSAEGKDATGHTLTLTIAGQFDCLNTALRTWSDTTQNVPCKDV